MHQGTVCTVCVLTNINKCMSPKTCLRILDHIQQFKCIYFIKNTRCGSSGADMVGCIYPEWSDNLRLQLLWIPV